MSRKYTEPPGDRVSECLFTICSVSPEAQASFIPIIDSILAASDLETISEKRIRKGLQAAVEYDITPQKVGCRPNSLYSFLMFHLGCYQSSHNGPVR